MCINTVILGSIYLAVYLFSYFCATVGSVHGQTASDEPHAANGGQTHIPGPAGPDRQARIGSAAYALANSPWPWQTPDWYSFAANPLVIVSPFRKYSDQH
jgi:hypothetical protein